MPHDDFLFHNVVELQSSCSHESYGMDAPTLIGIDVPKWKCWLPLNRMGASTMKITAIGIDLAKNVFQVHGVDERPILVNHCVEMLASKLTLGFVCPRLAAFPETMQAVIQAAHALRRPV